MKFLHRKDAAGEMSQLIDPIRLPYDWKLTYLRELRSRHVIGSSRNSVSNERHSSLCGIFGRMAVATPHQSLLGMHRLPHCPVR